MNTNSILVTSSITDPQAQSALDWLLSENAVKLRSMHAAFEEACRKDAGFNLFLLISARHHWENFHSDVIRNILSPASPHGHGDQFLRLFLEFLNREHHTQINPGDYQNAVVTREEGRIDILIRTQKNGETKGKAIVIENKINGAPDMERQIPRYIEVVKSRWNCECDAIVYLTLNQAKDPDKSTWNDGDHNEVKQPLLSICAVGQQKGEDLLTGWLTPCLELAKKQSQNHPVSLASQEPAFVIYQYQQLLLHLGRSLMNTELIHQFYEMLLTNSEHFQSANTVSLLLSEMPAFRCQQMNEKLKGKISPFVGIYEYKKGGLAIHGLPVNQKLSANLKIHLNFEPTETRIEFWDNTENREGPATAPAQVLDEIELKHEFTQVDDWFLKVFKFPEEECKVLAFLTEQFLPKLKTYCEAV